MSDEGIPLSMRKKLLECMRRKLLEKAREETLPKPKSPKEIVYNALEDEKAKEILELAKEQYPEAYDYIIEVLAKLIEKGIITSLDGYTLYNILLQLGVNVRLPIRIKFVKKGKTVDIKEYLKD